jgi:hypothetical protein
MAVASNNRVRTAALAEASATDLARAALHRGERGTTQPLRRYFDMRATTASWRSSYGLKPAPSDAAGNLVSRFSLNDGLASSVVLAE